MEEEKRGIVLMFCAFCEEVVLLFNDARAMYKDEQQSNCANWEVYVWF